MRAPRFIDSDKPFAFAATYTFLVLNGLLITADPDATFAVIDGRRYARAFEFSPLAAWLREHTEES